MLVVFLMDATGLQAEHRDAYRTCVLPHIDAAVRSQLPATLLAKRIITLQCGTEALELAQILNHARVVTEGNIPERDAPSLKEHLDLLLDALGSGPIDHPLAA